MALQRNAQPRENTPASPLGIVTLNVIFLQAVDLLTASLSFPGPGWPPPQPLMVQGEPCPRSLSTPFPHGLSSRQKRNCRPCRGPLSSMGAQPAFLAFLLLPTLVSVCTLPCRLPALAELPHPREHLLSLRDLLPRQLASCVKAFKGSISPGVPFVGSLVLIGGYLAPELRAN